MLTPNEGIELLYTRDCQHFQEALANLNTALKELNIVEDPRLIIIDTQDQAELYNFFASPTVHIHGVDADPKARRINKRRVGQDRPYFWQNNNFTTPPIELLIQAIKDLY